MSEEIKEATYTKSPRIPTPEEAEKMERILIQTQFKEGEYIAIALYKGKELETGGYSTPYGAFQHLKNVIIERQTALGLERSIHYIFTSRVD